jgi:hypothetical protein
MELVGWLVGQLVRCVWEDNIKSNLGEVMCRDISCIHLAQDMVILMTLFRPNQPKS